MAVNSSLRSINRFVVAVMNNCAGHTTENRFNHIKELRSCREWCQLNHWPTAISNSCIMRIHTFVKLFGNVPRSRIPREIESLPVTVVFQQDLQQPYHLSGVLSLAVKMGDLISG